MIVYFKRLANLLMAVGGIVGGALGLLYFQGHILDNADKTTIFWWSLWIIAGILIGRVIGARMASRKLMDIQSILYKDNDPKRFLERFAPLNERIPHELAEYCNGQNSISFAHEALGEFDQAMEDIKELKPELLKMHALTTSSLIVNQKTNLQILRRDYEAAVYQLDDLKHLKELSDKRAKMLAANLEQQIKLHEIRIAMAKGELNADVSYIEEEIRLSTNLIHKKEMQLELAEYNFRLEKKEEATKLLQEILADKRGFYSETRAEELLADSSKVYHYTEPVKDAHGNEIGSVDSDGFVVIRE